jgi:excisionase family DNA binding protein
MRRHSLDLIKAGVPQKVLSGDFLTVQQLAGLLQCSRHTIYVWVCKNQLPISYYKFPRGVRFKRAEVEKWIESRKIMPVDSL